MMSAEARRNFHEDGVTVLRSVLDDDWLAELKQLWQWSMDHPGPLAAPLLREEKGAGEVGAQSRQDLCNPGAAARYADVLMHSPVADVIADAWAKPDVWFMYEQVFHKPGGNAGRTPWHQDLSYLAVNGQDLAVMWISFEPQPAELSLEFVRGSHRGPLFDGSRFDPNDPTLPLYGTGDLPRLPDIEADRNAWDIVSFAVVPGDVVLFHPAMLHGGAPTRGDHPERCTLTLRFFGEDAVYEPRPGPAGPFYRSWKDELAPGDSFRHERFLKLR